MIKIAAIYPNMRDICSFYRGHGAMAELRHIDSNIVVHPYDTANNKFTANWLTLKEYDIIYFQRPVDKRLNTFLSICKNLRKKIWFDYDDLLTDIPEYNGCLDPLEKEGYTSAERREYRKQRQKEIVEGFETCVKYADIITVSTNFLKKAWYKIHSDIRIVPNAFDDYLFDVSKHQPIKAFTKTFAWRGSHAHGGDLKEFEDQILRFDKAHNVGWMWYQHNRREITENLKNIELVKSVDTTSFFNGLLKAPINIFICPLQDNPFNRAKANNLAMEATWGGSVSITPDWEEWQNMNDGFRYTSKEDFYTKLESSISDQKRINGTIKSNWSYILNNRLLSNVNKKRLEIIKELAR